MTSSSDAYIGITRLQWVKKPHLTLSTKPELLFGMDSMKMVTVIIYPKQHSTLYVYTMAPHRLYSLAWTGCLEGQQSGYTSPGQWKLWDMRCPGNVNPVDIVHQGFGIVQKPRTMVHVLGPRGKVIKMLGAIKYRLFDKLNSMFWHLLYIKIIKIYNIA